MSPTSWNVAIAVAFLVGVLLFGIGSSMLRSRREESSPISWTGLIDPALVRATLPQRLEMVERLSILRNDWSREILERARAEEDNSSILAAIESVLGTG